MTQNTKIKVVKRLDEINHESIQLSTGSQQRGSLADAYFGFVDMKKSEGCAHYDGQVYRGRHVRTTHIDR